MSDIKPQKKKNYFKYFSIKFIGIILFIPTVLLLAFSGASYDALGDYEYSEDLSYDIWSSYVKTFWA